MFVFYSFQGTREVKRIRDLGGQSGGGVYFPGLIRKKKKIESQLSPMEKVMTKHVNSFPINNWKLKKCLFKYSSNKVG